MKFGIVVGITLCTLGAGLLVAGEVRTLAGIGTKGTDGEGGPALQAQLSEPFGVVRGPDGLIYFCEFSGHVIRRISATGEVETLAGIHGQAGYEGDGGPANQAKLNKPHEIRFDKNGDLFVSDMSNHAIRKLQMKSGTISTVAGTGKKGFSGDGGPATKAEFNDPISIQFGPGGDLYICDIGNHRVRVLEMRTGHVSTLCGNGKKEAPRDKADVSPQTPLHGPRALDFDAKGNLWLVLREGNAVFELDLQRRKIAHIAGTGKAGFSGNGGPAKKAELSGPKGISLTPDGTKFYLADTESHTIRCVDLKSGKIDVAVGTGQKGDGPDGAAATCQLSRPHGVWVDEDGSVFIGDSENHRLRVLDPGK